MLHVKSVKDLCHNKILLKLVIYDLCIILYLNLMSIQYLPSKALKTKNMYYLSTEDFKKVSSIVHFTDILKKIS